MQTSSCSDAIFLQVCCSVFWRGFLSSWPKDCFFVVAVRSLLVLRSSLFWCFGSFASFAASFALRLPSLLHVAKLARSASQHCEAPSFWSGVFLVSSVVGCGSSLASIYLGYCQLAMALQASCSRSNALSSAAAVAAHATRRRRLENYFDTACNGANVYMDRGSSACDWLHALDWI